MVIDFLFGDDDMLCNIESDKMDFKEYGLCVRSFIFYHNSDLFWNHMW